MRTYLTSSADETRALGRSLGRAARAGTQVWLCGDLGAGKTVFSKGVGDGLDVRTTVTSPTYVLVALHEGGRLPLAHADLYRLGDGSELDHLGLDEALQDGVVLVEWADRFASDLAGDHLEVHLEFTESGRQIRLVATGPLHQHLEQLE
ncbi:MAG: tRNA threonylcarbamoyladenosine biosynthesis protein TsaE [Kiritimatiellia bacterium]